MRPTYETTDDLANERQLANYLAERTQSVAQKAPARYPLDYLFSRGGELVAMAEIKIRKVEKERFSTYMLSAAKVADARLLSATTGVPVFLCVKWQCESVGLLDIIEEPDDIGIGGRRDRGDPDDLEPVLYWKIERFKILKNGVKSW